MTGVPVRGFRPGAVADLPTGGGDPYVVAIVARRVSDGGLLLPQRPEVLQRVELTPELVGRMGGPGRLRDAFEADRIKYARGARARGLKGWAVEVDVTRGHARTVWPVSHDPAPTLEVPRT